MIDVLVVEDEPIAARAHASYLGRLDGFRVVATATSAAEALRAVGREHPDLVLLDMRLPDGHGLELLHRLRAAGELCDVIAVTSVRDVEVVRRALALGVTHYLVKPFTFEDFRAKLLSYQAYRERLRATGGATGPVAQDDIDRLVGLRTAGASASLPKGIAAETLQAVRQLLATAGRPLSASEVAVALGSSRVTARRYLEHLAIAGQCDRHERYGHAGRPEVEYAWR